MSETDRLMSSTQMGIKIESGIEKNMKRSVAGDRWVGKLFQHGWEIAVILRNFRKTKLSKSTIFVLFFF